MVWDVWADYCFSVQWGRNRHVRLRFLLLPISNRERKPVQVSTCKLIQYPRQIYSADCRRGRACPARLRIAATIAVGYGKPYPYDVFAAQIEGTRISSYDDQRNWNEAETKRRNSVPNVVRCGLIQAANDLSPESHSLAEIKKAMVAKHLKLIEQAGRKRVQILCLQELFYGPYFCAEQNARWYELTERVPQGPTIQLMMKLAKKHRMVMIVPVYEEEITGLYFNTAAVIDADGRYLGKYRKHHIPHCHPGFWEKFYFTPGNLGYPVFKTRYANIGVYICYDRHFPEGARVLGLKGAEIVFNPSATVAGLSEYLWELEQPAHAVANGYFVAAINRVGHEKPWDIGEFYGKSYFCNPRGKIVAQASRNKDELLVADLDLDLIRQVRSTWQFFRDRRPESYSELTEIGSG
jgi:beta-ureidopropionase